MPSKGFTQHHFWLKNGAGFTFIELVIVILLIGILIAAIGPRILHLQDSFKVEAAAEQIANHIRLAQSRAIAEHPSTGTKKFGVGFDTGGNLYSVYDQAGSAVTDPLKGGSFSLWGIDFDSDVQLKGVDIDSTTGFTGGQITFNALGKPTEGGSVTIIKGSSTLNIGVATETGAVSIW